jgi:hypothetical protein
MPDERGRGSLAQQAEKETPQVAAGTSAETLASSAKGAQAEKPATERVSPLPSDLDRNAAASGVDKKPSSQSSSESPKSGASTRTVVEDIRRDTPASGKSGSETSPKDDLPFKKHDHVKYTEKIKNKAIDQLTKKRRHL